VRWFRGGLVFKAHRLCVSLNSRLGSNNDEEEVGGLQTRGHASNAPSPKKPQPMYVYVYMRRTHIMAYIQRQYNIYIYIIFFLYIYIYIYISICLYIYIKKNVYTAYIHELIYDSSRRGGLQTHGRVSSARSPRTPPTRSLPPLEARQARILNVGLLILYQSRAGAGGYPRARLSRGTFMEERAL